MDLVFDGKCLTVKDGADISLATISEMRIVSDTECSYKIGKDTVTLTVEWDSNGDMINIKKKHSLNEDEQEQEKEELEGTVILTRLGKSVILEGGRLKSEMHPDKMENLTENNKIKVVMYYDKYTVTVTGTSDTDESGKELIKDLKLEIDEYEPIAIHQNNAKA